MSKLYTIKQVQRLPISPEEAWAFFSSPRNLAVITPKELGFKITSGETEGEIFEGQIITYIVKPLLGIPLFWKTKICKVERHRVFVDEQLKGPYAFWHHEHRFLPIDGGVEMQDTVQYKIPFGVFGALGTPIVKAQLNKIFNYRKQKVTELFGTING